MLNVSVLFSAISLNFNRSKSNWLSYLHKTLMALFILSIYTCLLFWFCVSVPFITGGVVVGNLTGGKPIDGFVLVVVIIGVDGILFGGVGGGGVGGGGVAVGLQLPKS